MFNFCLHIVNYIFIFSLHGNALHMGNTHHTILGGSQRNDYRIVLVLSHTGRTFSFQHTNNLERCFFNTHNLTNRVITGEQIIRYSFTNNSNSCAAVHIAFSKKSAVFQFVVLNSKITGSSTFNTAGPVLVAGYQLVRSIYACRNSGDTINLLFNGEHIVKSQACALTCCQASTSSSTTASRNHQQVTT